jgi:hypothetical protein
MLSSGQISIRRCRAPTLPARRSEQDGGERPATASSASGVEVELANEVFQGQARTDSFGRAGINFRKFAPTQPGASK